VDIFSFPFYIVCFLIQFFLIVVSLFYINAIKVDASARSDDLNRPFSLHFISFNKKRISSVLQKNTLFYYQNYTKMRISIYLCSQYFYDIETHGLKQLNNREPPVT
jgi:hypothetical protein